MFSADFEGSSGLLMLFYISEDEDDTLIISSLYIYKIIYVISALVSVNEYDLRACSVALVHV